MTEKDELDLKHNPWSVTNIDEFLYFCCPECDNKTQSRGLFINHAYLHHPRAREALPQIDDDFTNDDGQINEPITTDVKEPVKLENEGLVDESNELFDLAYGDAEDNDVPEVDLDLDDDEYKPLKPPARRGRKPKSKQTTSVSAINNIKKEDLNDNNTSTNTTNNDLEHQNPNAECQCYYCGDMVFYKNIQEHMKSAHGRFHRKMFGAPRPLQCEVCRATFEKQSALTSHSCYTNFIPTKVRGGDPYKCDICKKTFTVKMGLRSHLNTVHSEERKFACVNCDFKAKSIVILNRHVERVHKNNLKHLCSHCGKKFFRAYDLRCHIHRVHKDIQGTEGQTCNFKCEDCSERFLDRRALNWHQKKAHNISTPTDKFITCEQCGQSFQTLHKLSVHKSLKHKNSELIQQQQQQEQFQVETKYEINPGPPPTLQNNPQHQQNIQEISTVQQAFSTGNVVAGGCVREVAGGCVREISGNEFLPSHHHHPNTTTIHVHKTD